MGLKEALEGAYGELFLIHTLIVLQSLICVILPLRLGEGFLLREIRNN